MYVSVCLSVFSVCLSVGLSVLSVWPSQYVSQSVSVCLYAGQLVYLSVCLSFFVSFRISSSSKSSRSTFVFSILDLYYSTSSIQFSSVSGHLDLFYIISFYTLSSSSVIFKISSLTWLIFSIIDIFEIIFFLFSESSRFMFSIFILVSWSLRILLFFSHHLDLPSHLFIYSLISRSSRSIVVWLVFFIIVFFESLPIYSFLRFVLYSFLFFRLLIQDWFCPDLATPVHS